MSFLELCVQAALLTLLYCVLLGTQRTLHTAYLLHGTLIERREQIFPSDSCMNTERGIFLCKTGIENLEYAYFLNY